MYIPSNYIRDTLICEYKRMRRKNYDKKILGLFDNLGLYFVRHYYGFLYRKSIDIQKQGSDKSLTDIYRGCVVNYMNGIDRDDLCKQVIMGLSESYQKEISLALSLSDFEDIVLSAFIPAEYYKSFSSSDKDRTFRQIVIKTVKELGGIVVGRNILPKIIDDHNNPNNVEIIQDQLLEIFIAQRDEFHELFTNAVASKVASGKLHDDKIGKNISKLKTELINEKKAKCEAENSRDRALEMLRQLMDTIAVRDKEISELKERTAFLSNMAYAPTRQPSMVATPQSSMVMNPQHSTLQPSTVPVIKPVSISPQISTPRLTVNTNKIEPKSNNSNNSNNTFHLSFDQEESSESDDITDEERARQQKSRLRNVATNANTATNVNVPIITNTDEDVWGM